ncbi:FecR family protein [Spirosoma harenae]
MNYRHYSAEDFLFDTSFRQWTNGMSPEAATFWEQWLTENPDRAEVVRQAQELIHALDDHYRDDATDVRIDHEINRLMQRAAENRTVESPIIEQPTRSPIWWRWAAAASILVIIGLGSWWYVNDSAHTSSAPYAHLTQKAGIPLIEKVNTGNRVLNILLDDGSLVTLRPNSRLSYPKHFNKDHRTVYLNGEAFFEVIRNPAKPFLIYANQTVTRVLGTSFLVRAFENEKNVVVTVRTGRVSVYKQQDFEKARLTGLRQIPGVILTPNQQMTLNPVNSQPANALVEKPKVAIPETLVREQIFEDAPVSNVLASIEKAYCINIQYSKADLSKCLVNVTFSNETLLEQLDVICQIIGASYDVEEGEVIIHSKGCQ